MRSLWTSCIEPSYIEPSYIEPSYIHRAKLHRAKLHRAKLHRAKLHRAKLHRAKLHRAKLHRAKLHRAKLHRAKFSTIELERSLFYTKFINEQQFQGCLQNVASGAPNGQFSTTELKRFFVYKIYQQSATSRTVSKMLLLELQILNSLKLNLHKLYQRTATSRIASKMSLVELQMASWPRLRCLIFETTSV